MTFFAGIYKKTTALCLILITLICPGTDALASQYVRITGYTVANVAEIIDGDSFVAKNTSTGQLSLVHLLGIDSAGETAAYDYLCANLQGKQVVLTTDSKAPVDARWSYVYASFNGSLVNTQLLLLGLAKVNRNHNGISYYAYFNAAERSASEAGAGIWDEPGTSEQAAFMPTNINTASLDMLAERFDISLSLARSIIEYRNYNPFNDIYEIRFVPWFTRDIFDANKINMTVCTNINTAAETELMSLGLSAEEAASIIGRRQSAGALASVTELTRYRLMPLGIYDKVKDFISVDTKATIDVTYNEYRVNINTASLAQLMKMGMEESRAKEIINLRGGFGFKNIAELQYAADLTDRYINSFEDNLGIITNVNTAAEYELLSLFGGTGGESYVRTITDNRPFNNIYALSAYLPASIINRLREHICFGFYETDYINVKTALYEDFIKLGVPSSTALSVIQNRASYKAPKDLPASLDGFRNNISILTNVNIAGYNELMSLSPLMTAELANEIIYRRRIQSYAYMSEIEDIFSALGKTSVYREIAQYICFR